ncbi:MAG TPA: glycine betaine ABC transporter substrate-binding protein, partial [Actinomycetota bacterium]|nr:glycine betaine ABC transporter substrate-binding protein [Actinomycetota bacterium]
MFVLGAGLLALSLLAAACNDSGGDDDTGGSASASESSASKPELTVGVSGPFAENQLVAEMYAQVLENAGYTVDRELEIADREVGNKALADDEIDLKPEYTGFDLPLYDKSAPTNGDPQAVVGHGTREGVGHGLRLTVRWGVLVVERQIE